MKQSPRIYVALASLFSFQGFQIAEVEFACPDLIAGRKHLMGGNDYLDKN